MGKTKEEKLQDAHNKGEKDESEGRYNPPHGTPLGGITNSKQQAQENDAYDRGVENTRNQKEK